MNAQRDDKRSPKAAPVPNVESREDRISMVRTKEQLGPGTNPAILGRIMQTLKEDITRESLALPILPEVVVRVLSASQATSLRELIEVVKRDPAMTAHLLRIANSPRYRTGVEVRSIDQAVVRLGLSNLRQLVVLIACRERVYKVDGHEAKLRDMFQHALMCALYCQTIARVRKENEEIAFLIGLLHDIGRPVLLQRIVDLQRAHKVILHEDEVTAILDKHHAEVGDVVARHWHIPAPIPKAIYYHHADQGPDDCKDLIATLQLAEALERTERAGIPFVPQGPGQEIDVLKDQREALREAATCFA